MNIAKLAVIAAGLLITAAPTIVAADSYWDVEAARANARAGGPTNAQDAELLERYGCLSGTRSSFCQRLSRGERPTYRQYRQPRRYAR